LSNSPGTHAVPAQPAGQAAQWSQHDTPRPGTLTATFIVADMAAVFGLAGAVLTFAVGKSMLRSMIGVGTLHGAAGDFVNGLIEAAYQTLQMRAIIAVVVAVILGVLAFAVRGGHTGVRIGLTVALLVAAGIWLLNVRDAGVPGFIRGLDGVALALCVIGIVLTWFPANQRFASDLKVGRRS
jgi:hypothetical protein